MAEASQMLDRGEVESASEAFVRLYDKALRQSCPEEASICLYHLATIHLNHRDTIGLKKEISRMKDIVAANPQSRSIRYDYFSVLQVYYCAMFEYTGNPLHRDSTLVAGKAAIACMEQMGVEEIKAKNINPVWNYYNIAVSYDLYFEEPVTDSIELWLDRAEVLNREPEKDENRRQQGRISIGDERAWLLYYDGEYDEAEKMMLGVLATIDSVEAETPYTVLTEKGEAYAFFVELYKTMGKADKALEYQTKKNECDRERFDVERNRAVAEIQAKYDLNKKDAQISRQRMWLAMIVGFVIAAVLTAVVIVYRRRNMDIEQRLISAASEPLSVTEKKYLHLFILGTPTWQIAKEMNVTQASVYSMKYRLKKKFPEGYIFPF